VLPVALDAPGHGGPVRQFLGVAGGRQTDELHHVAGPGDGSDDAELPATPGYRLYQALS
jgi:hypothetical protein